MIVPRSRLLLWVGLVLVPFSLLWAADPRLAWFAFAVMGAFGLSVVVDAFRGRPLLKGLIVECPKVTRMSRERAGKIEVRIRNPQPGSMAVTIGLAFPRELGTDQAELSVSLPAGSEWSRLQWPCRPLKRGRLPLATAHMEAVSPMGFWGLRKSLPLGAEIRVYPNLVSERKNLAALFLNRGSFGLHAQRQLGKGREFEKLREYVPGDGYDELHWKATARRGRPITKVYQIERTQEVYVVLDASRLSARPAPVEAAEGAGEAPEQTTALERFLTAALVLGLAAEQQGDLFGLLTFSDKVDRFIRARNGKAHYSACRDAIYTLDPRIVTPDYDELCSFIRLRLRRRALLIFLTSLDDPVLAESFVRNLDLIRRQHLVMVNMIQPAGVEPVFTNPHVATTDQLYEHLAGHMQWHQLRELEKVLQRRGVSFSLLKNERLATGLVAQYLNVKRRQVL
jgi:uncharacterized protein (DUF58 family)